MSDQIIETKSCKNCGTQFSITDLDMNFYDKISPIFNGKKYLIPSPTFCPYCREQRRLSFRNERKLYKRTCDATGKNIISMFSSDKKYTVFNGKDWRSDKWNPLDYGKEFDFSRSFFDQFSELSKNVPLQSMHNSNTENSEYNNYIYGAKNCYMSSVVYYDAEEVYYSSWVYGGGNIIDCFMSDHSENCYESIDIKNCFHCFYSRNLTSCQNCFHSRNLAGCQYCIGCSNLKNKKYYILNKSVSKEEFEKTLLSVHNIESKTKYQSFIKNGIFRYSNNLNCENCSGEYLNNCKNVLYGYDMGLGEDCKYISSEESNNCYDGRGGGNEKCYEFNNLGRAKNSLFGDNVIESRDIIYSFHIHQGQNLFGCIGLRNKQYCILNKQYTKEEYELTVARIIEHMQRTGEWGEFFPTSMSPFGYNETVAQEYFPLTKEEAITKGYKWQDKEYPINIPDGIQTITANQLPENILEITDDILSKAIICEITGKPFRIIKPELDFYRKHNIPIPRKHPDQRHLERFTKRNPRKLFDRNCDKCSIELKSTYSPKRPEIVYCEKCYNEEVY